MISTKIEFHFRSDDQPLLKKAAELHLRHVAPGHRLELLARWCGFSSHAAYQAALRNVGDADLMLKLDVDGADRFAKDRKIEAGARLLYKVLASAVMPKVAREYPYLHNWGYGLNCLQPSRDECKEIASDAEPSERWSAVQNWIGANLASRRVELLSIENRGGVLQALAFVSCIQPIKTPNRHRSSYGLKHVAEDLAFILPGNVVLDPSYVGNRDLIAAALYAGFSVHQPGYIRGDFNSSPNPSFNMSARSLAVLDAERDRLRRAA
jgi:hypothetical protein